MVGSCPYPQKIDKAGKGLPGTNVLRKFVNYVRKKFYNIGTWFGDHEKLLSSESGQN